MYRLSDFNQVGMPTRAETETPEQAYAVAEALGFRASACVEPIAGHTPVRSGAYRLTVDGSAAPSIAQKAEEAYAL